MKKTSAPKTPRKRKAVSKQEFSIVNDLLWPLYLSKEEGMVQSKVKKWSAELEKAAQSGWIRQEKKGKSILLTLSAEGELYLLKNLPREKSVEMIQQKKGEWEKSLENWRRATKDILCFFEPLHKSEEVKKLEEDFQKTFEEGTKEIRFRLEKLHAIAEMVGLGEKYQKALQNNYDEFANFVRQIQAQSKQQVQEIENAIHGLEIQLQAWNKVIAPPELLSTTNRKDVAAHLQEQTVGQASQTFSFMKEVSESALSNAVLKTETKPAPSKAPSPPVVPFTPPFALKTQGVVSSAEPKQETSISPSDPKLVECMEKAYREIVQEQNLILVDLPELYAKIQPQFPHLTISQYKDLLNKLCNDSIIDLSPVNDRGQLKQPEFGIPAKLGDLYYVVWR